ncbi:hypothetical protein An18g04380 [Aspergillus niger]|uniref:Uncharacterized protein n=2 Tax=Aspergillus niger TaxID=5061 RepID=A2RAU6_ASPNC|nr:hypothetical protein An18g04380 [Aspergillus niger]CAK43242.1 hypothetical protein An18g04380 [Aspergillus niger]
MLKPFSSEVEQLLCLYTLDSKYVIPANEEINEDSAEGGRRHYLLTTPYYYLHLLTTTIIIPAGVCPIEVLLQVPQTLSASAGAAISCRRSGTTYFHHPTTHTAQEASLECQVS